MHVMTMEGGFRGLRGKRGFRGGLDALPHERRLAAEEGFVRRFDEFYQTRDRLFDMSSAGELPARTFEPLAARFDELDGQIVDHQNTLEAIETEAGLRSWQERARQLASEATRWTRRAQQILGDTTAGRGLRIFLLATASIAVIGGTTYWVTQVWPKR